MQTFQEIIQNLIDFWAAQGCTVHQGHDVEVGAGTFNPATFLRSLGPEPYKAVYVEPSRRPQDGRYGDNPNRLQLFHQLQVVIKPSPLDIQKKYLQSLEVIGFDLKKHDIRFVHDDWESPTLGAWGLGWEVWIDGMEVTQFTYFQSVAGIDLDPITVEITYGLERLCMLAQQKDNFFEMQYSPYLNYGDVFHRNEVEWSKYNFDSSSSDMWFRHFDDYEKEAKTLIELNLPIPAYDFVMKASHAFNMLEARGVISTTERTGYIHRIRDLAKLSAICYLASREELSHPLMKRFVNVHNEEEALEQEIIQGPFDPEKAKDFLFEIGIEQLPATFVPIGMRGLKTHFETFLKKNALKYENIEVFGTPQRLAILIKQLHEGTAEKTIERRGPQIEVAFTEDGTLSKQGLGFCTSLGLEPFTMEQLQAKEVNVTTKEIKGKTYLFASIVEPSQCTKGLLAEFCKEIFNLMSFPKSMRWHTYSLTFARPLQWIVALYGKEVIPVSVVNLKASNESFGHAQLCPEKIPLVFPSEYEQKLLEHNVIANCEKRKEAIEKQLLKIEKDKKLNALKKDRVLKEVLFLTEWPELAIYPFSKEFLSVPSEILISEMVEHQRYFPLADSEGNLAPYFVITADNTVSEIILHNNLSVLSARLSDGVFLYQQDLKCTLDEFNEKLKTVTFHKQLGSVFEKIKRISMNAQLLHDKLCQGNPSDLQRAALYCKSDLASELVGEFPELQGVIGMHYAKHQGENEEVCKAIQEHWLPNSEGGTLPETTTGKIISLADKLDNLISYFSVGIKPSSSKDPYALRRQALGIIRILIDSKWPLDLEATILEIEPKKQLLAEIKTFMLNRMKTVYEEMGFAKDAIEGVLSFGMLNPYRELKKLQALQEFRQTSTQFSGLIEVYRRAKGQIADAKPPAFAKELLQEAAEKNLFEALDAVDIELIESIEKHEFTKAFELLTTLQRPLAQLFDEVKILDENEEIKNNRIALLQGVFKHFGQLIDLSKLQIS